VFTLLASNGTPVEITNLSFNDYSVVVNSATPYLFLINKLPESIGYLKKRRRKNLRSQVFSGGTVPLMIRLIYALCRTLLLLLLLLSLSALP
jgi:hypothetical protein